MVFARKLVGDVLSFPELADGTVRLTDIDEGCLARTTEAAEAMVENGDVAADIQSTPGDQARSVDGGVAHPRGGPRDD